MTRRRKPTAKSVLAEIEELERQIEADQDAELEADAEAIADEDKDIAEESTGYSVDDQGDQNEKSMDNWPVDDREAVAARLVRMAKALMKSND
jgi:hypothetical protein